MTGQVSANVKRERKNSLSDISGESEVEGEKSGEISCRSSDSEYLPDIPLVKKRKKLPARKRRLDSDNTTHGHSVPDFVKGSEGQCPEHDGKQETSCSKESHDESVKSQGGTRKSPHSESIEN